MVSKVACHIVLSIAFVSTVVSIGRSQTFVPDVRISPDTLRAGQTATVSMANMSQFFDRVNCAYNTPGATLSCEILWDNSQSNKRHLDDFHAFSLSPDDVSSVTGVLTIPDTVDYGFYNVSLSVNSHQGDCNSTGYDALYILPPVSSSVMDAASTLRSESPVAIRYINGLPLLCFSVPQERHVQIYVFDALGREINRFDGQSTGEFQTFEWTHSNTPSGMYFYKIVVEGVPSFGKISFGI
jgi:hypothetical protein